MQDQKPGKSESKAPAAIAQMDRAAYTDGAEVETFQAVLTSAEEMILDILIDMGYNPT